MKDKNSKKDKPKSGLAIASIILGLISFIPLLGVLLGVLAIILGAIALLNIKNSGVGGKKLAIGGIILGILGILFTVILYGSIIYFFRTKQDGPLSRQKIEGTQKMLVQDAAYLELYKKKFEKYPTSLEELFQAGYQVIGADFYQQRTYYKVSNDGQSYELRSLGADGVYGTSDDILPTK